MIVAIDRVVSAARACNPAPDMAGDLRAAVLGLFDLLRREKVDFLLVGGVALLAYVEARNTEDIDLIVSPEDARRLPWNAVLTDQDFGRASFDGVQIDLLLTSNALFSDVRRSHRGQLEFAGHGVPCASREGLLILKLFALPSLYRQGKLARAALYETDIRMLLQGASVDEDAILAVVAGHVSSTDLRELKRILAEQRPIRAF
jgi:hypothetical protein